MFLIPTALTADVSACPVTTATDSAPSASGVRLYVSLYVITSLLSLPAGCRPTTSGNLVPVSAGKLQRFPTDSDEIFPED